MGDYGADANPDVPSIQQVAFGYLLAPCEKLKVDQFSTLTTDKVFHCVQKLGSTNISFLVDRDKIPS